MVLAAATLLVAGALSLRPDPAAGAGAGAGEAGQYAASSVPRISMDEFTRLLEGGAIVVIDVRSRDAYRAAHIPGAISVPLDTVAARAAELKAAGKPVVAYCA
jgi:3-mercaptopyruvate sulfurtransferase SseA